MKKINFARIIERLTKAFQLSNLVDEPFVLSETVIPVYDIERTMSIYKNEQFTIPFSAASTFYTLMTVPAGKRYEVQFFRFYKATGTFTFEQAYIYDGTSRTTVKAYTSAVNDFQYEGNYKSFYMEEGESLQTYTVALTGAGDCVLIMRYREVDWKK